MVVLLLRAIRDDEREQALAATESELSPECSATTKQAVS